MKKTIVFIMCIISFVLCGGGKNEDIVRLQDELQNKQREIERLSAALTARENDLRKLRIWLAGTVSDGKILSVSDREQRLLTGLKTLADVSEDMVLESLNFSELLRPKLNALPLSSADRVRLIMALEELERSAARVSSVAGTGRNNSTDMLQQVRVVAVRPELDMAVISAGALHGIFPGMIFATADGKIKLRVTETRPQVAGVTVIQGKLNSLAPGSRVKLQMSMVKSEDHFLRRPDKSKGM